jgi:hypothetical protein
MGTKKQQRWAKKLNLATIVRSLFCPPNNNRCGWRRVLRMRRNKRKTEELRRVVYES